MVFVLRRTQPRMFSTCFEQFLALHGLGVECKWDLLQCEQRNLLFFFCRVSDQGWWDKQHRGQFWRSSQLYSPCQRSELSCWHPSPWEWRRASVLDCSAPDPHRPLWRDLPSQWVSDLSHHPTCATRFCQLPSWPWAGETFPICIFDGPFYHQYRYSVHHRNHMQVIDLNALNITLCDQKSFHLTSLQHSPSLFL